ncbi:MAG: MltA domain-containing protein [Pseudomonadota bacterium]|nr:MltA domain-containing protein [Pseudomonadota bacterium]
MRIFLIGLLALSGCVSQGYTAPLYETTLVSPEKSLMAFKASCDKPNATKVLSSNNANQWQSVCQSITTLDLMSSEAAQAFWAKHFKLLPQTKLAKVSGYYTQELVGSLKPTQTFKTPIYAVPDQCMECYDRAAIESGSLKNKAEEILYIKDNVERYFTQLQGAAVVHLTNGQTKRLVVAGKNNFPYHFIKISGSLQYQREWLYNHPEQINSILARNPSFIYYELSDDPVVKGNRGVPLTAGHSVAVDKTIIPSGTPILLGDRIVIAQDVGRAIHGNGRFDLYWGVGQAAEKIAGGYLTQSTWSVLAPKA